MSSWTRSQSHPSHIVGFASHTPGVSPGYNTQVGISTSHVRSRSGKVRLCHAVAHWPVCEGAPNFPLLIAWILYRDAICPLGRSPMVASRAEFIYIIVGKSKRFYWKCTGFPILFFFLFFSNTSLPYVASYPFPHLLFSSFHVVTE